MGVTEHGRDGPLVVAHFNFDLQDGLDYEAAGLVRPHPLTVRAEVFIGPSSVEVAVGGVRVGVEHRGAVVRGYVIDGHGRRQGLVEEMAAGTLRR